MIDPALNWATNPGPPNYVFVLALLTAPHLWSRYVKRAAEHAYNRYTGE